MHNIFYINKQFQWKWRNWNIKKRNCHQVLCCVDKFNMGVFCFCFCVFVEGDGKCKWLLYEMKNLPWSGNNEKNKIIIKNDCWILIIIWLWFGPNMMKIFVWRQTFHNNFFFHSKKNRTWMNEWNKLERNYFSTVLVCS